MTGQENEDSTAGFRPEHWTYTGTRQGKPRTKAWGAWQDDTGREMVFEKLKGTVIGGIYQVQVKRDPGGKFESVLLGADWTGDRDPDDDKRGEWATVDRTTATAIALARAERKARDDPARAFDEAMKPVRSLFQATARTRYERAAFIAMVTEALYRS